MNRLQKKCFVASASFHLLLLLILLAGPAFMSSKPKESDAPILNVIPAITVDEALSGGGKHNAQPPPPAPVPRQPDPPRPEPTPEPKVTKSSPPQRNNSVTPAPKPRTIKPNLNLTRRPVDHQEKPPRPPTDNSTAEAINVAIQTIQTQTSGRTRIETPGPGTSGMSYGNFIRAIERIYSEAWILPDGAVNSATVVATVTIARDGRVVSWRIVERSGNSITDESVEMTLRRVVRAVRLPSGSKERERTVPIRFNVAAKLGLG